MKIPVKCTSKPGLSVKAFEDLCNRKRRKIQTIRDQNKVNELVYATQMNLRETGTQEAAKVVKNITTAPTRGTKYLKSYKIIPSRPQLTPIRALFS